MIKNRKYYIEYIRENQKYIFIKDYLLYKNANIFYKSKNTLLNLIKKNPSTIFWYRELVTKKNIIRSFINNKSSSNQEKIYARKCNIKKINTNVKNDFLNKNHIQGTDKSNIVYGLYFNDNLVGVMTFNNKRSMNGQEENNIYELSRYATKLNRSIIGGFSKILKKFIDDYKPHKVISFLDRRLNNSKNNVYSINNFRLEKTYGTDYFYLDNNLKHYHKFNYGKNSIKKKHPNIYNPNKTETIMTFELGLVKIYDCGKFKYQIDFDNDYNIIAGYIYQIRNTKNNKLYIGQTTRSLSKRKNEYKKSLLYNEFYNNHLHNAFKKYGFDNFEFTIIDTANSIEELNEKEIKYINEYNTIDKSIGYNLHLGGRNAIPSSETLEKMSKAHKGIKQSEEWVKKRIPPKGSKEALKHGRPKTEEQKRYLSENSPKYWEGKKRDQSTIDKIKETKLKNNDALKNKINFGKIVEAYNPDTGEVYNEFLSTADAADAYNVNQSTISRRCSGKSKNKGEVFFRYKN